MKKIVLALALSTLLFSCKEETKEKLEDAKEAVSSEVKEGIDSAKAKAEKELVDTVVVKSAEKLETTAKKLKESVKK